MRKITQETATALLNGYDLKVSNTEVNNSSMFLFGNEIAKIENGALFVNLCGYDTNTTKERLNGVCELYNGTRPFYSGNDYITNGWIEIIL